MAGGPDNGSNGGTSGDGIPDGFAWNGSNSITYGANDVGGLTLGQRGGTGTVVTLLSNGGDMILRGATSNNNSYPGITSQSNLKIVSGTGKITMYGKSSSDHGVELTYGTAPSIAISSASTSSPALDLKGTTTASGYAGFWLSNNANGSILFESTAASGGGMTIEGVSSNSSGLWFGVSNTNIITQLLSQSGTITLKGDGGSNASLYLYGDLYIGNRKDATAIQGVTPSVTASTANILIQADDQYNFGNTGASTGAGTVDLGFTWVPANNVSGTFVSPKLLHYNGSSWNILSGSPTFDLVAGTLSYTGYSGSFSPFGVGESNFILPVSWLSFTGTAQGKTIVLNWATASESNNDHYEIERSANGVQYTTIGEVAAAANPTIRNDYQFTDINPISGTAYYRLKQTDLDGRFRYSTVIAVNYTGNGGFELRVIPGSGLVGLIVPATVSGKADVMIYDAQGRQLQRQTVVAGQQTLTLNAGSSNTIYLIKVVKDGKTLYTGRFML